MLFTIDTEQNNKISFLDVKLILKQGKLTTSVYQRAILSGVYTHFDGFLPDTYKISMISTLVNRCFQ